VRREARGLGAREAPNLPSEWQGCGKPQVRTSAPVPGTVTCCPCPRSECSNTVHMRMQALSDKDALPTLLSVAALFFTASTVAVSTSRTRIHGEQRTGALVWLGWGTAGVVFLRAISVAVGGKPVW
jgi:hypothetical protein